jgi:hypothetical protein
LKKINKWIGGLTAAGVVGLAGVLLESARENKLISTSHYEFCDERIKEDFNAVVLADLHGQTYGKDNSILLQRIDEEEPDAILIAGDMIVGKPGYSIDGAVDLINTLSQKYPVYIGRGNHELRTCVYPLKYGSMWQELYDGTKDNARWLINEKVYLEKYNITISGLDIPPKYYKRFRLPDMESALISDLLGDIKTDSYNILLAHNPDYFKCYAAYGADLTFSGHVHGGMVILPFIGGVLSPLVRIFPKYFKGSYESEGKHMVVSAGLGNHTFKIRVNNKPDLVVIRLKSFH